MILTVTTGLYFQVTKQSAVWFLAESREKKLIGRAEERSLRIDVGVGEDEEGEEEEEERSNEQGGMAKTCWDPCLWGQSVRDIGVVDRRPDRPKMAIGSVP